MKRFSVLLSLALVSFLLGAGVTYVATSTTWVSDMANQASIKAQEMPFETPRGAVPVGPVEMHLAVHQSQPTSPTQETTAPAEGHHGGAAPAGPDHHGGTSPAPMDHHGGAAPAGPDHHGGASPSPQGHHGGAAPAGPSHHESTVPSPKADQGGASTAGPAAREMAMGHGPQAVNPVRPTASSIKEGESLFGIYCSVCHGAKGQGGMPIAARYPKIPRFAGNLLQQTPDSHMFSMLTSGHGPMPGYAEALSGSDRWAVINYLRSLQNEL